MINFLPLGFEQSYVDHQDPFTHEISDYWEGIVLLFLVLIFGSKNTNLPLETFTCGGQTPGTGTLSLVSMDAEASKWATAFAGYQYVRKVECGETWQYKAEKQVND